MPTSDLAREDSGPLGSRKFAVPLAMWSFAEALLWFIVPDVLLFAMGVVKPEGHRRRALLSLVFSGLGIVVMGILCQTISMEEILFCLPLTYPKMGERVIELGSQWGSTCALYQAWSLIPVKVWTWAVVEHLHWWFPAYLFWVGLGRGVRMLLFSWAGSLVGRAVPGLRTKSWAILYGLFSFGLLYLLGVPFR